MSDELEKWKYRYVEEKDNDGNILSNRILSYPKEEYSVVRPAESKPALTEAQIRAIASEVGRENKVNHNGLIFIIVLVVAFIVVMAMILVACQHQPVIIKSPTQQPNCHFLCGE